MFVSEFVKKINGVVHKYSDDQPRDERGRFASAGTAAEGASTKKEHAAAAEYHRGQAKSERQMAEGVKGHSDKTNGERFSYNNAAKHHDEAARDHEAAAKDPKAKVPGLYHNASARARGSSMTAHAMSDHRPIRIHGNTQAHGEEATGATPGQFRIKG